MPNLRTSGSHRWNQFPRDEEELASAAHHPLSLSFPLCLMGWFAEKIHGFQERAHGGGELGGGGQDDAE